MKKDIAERGRSAICGFRSDGYRRRSLRRSTITLGGHCDLLKGSGSYYGYSTYTFEDGSITARYTGSIKDGKSKGEYTILSGTGAYANATGTRIV